MPLSSSTVWEIRTTGNALNGAGYNAASTGVAGSIDYSQQDAPQVSYTDLVIGATNTDLTSAATPFTAAHVGNLIKIASGTGFTLGYYEVISVAAGVATMDRAVGTAGSTGGVGRLGGAASHPNDLAATADASNTTWVKTGTYLMPDSVTFTASSVSLPTASNPHSRFLGYRTTRGDIYPGSPNNAYRPVFESSGTGAVTGGLFLRFQNTRWWVSGIEVRLGVGMTGTALSLGSASVVTNCKVVGYSTYGIILGSGKLVAHCEVSGGRTGGSGGIFMNGSVGAIAYNNYVHDNVGVGMDVKSVIAMCNIVERNTGNGIAIGGVGDEGVGAMGNTVHANSLAGISVHASSSAMLIQGNILSENGTYGITGSAGIPAQWQIDGNAFYANASGEISGLNDAGATRPVYTSGPYTPQHNVTLSASPFVNAAGSDLSLNSTAGGGVLCRNAGMPKSWPGLAVASTPDMGAVDQQTSGGGLSISFMGF